MYTCWLSCTHIGIVAPVSNGWLTMQMKQSISAGNAILTNVMPFKLWTVERTLLGKKIPVINKSNRIRRKKMYGGKQE